MRSSFQLVRLAPLALAATTAACSDETISPAGTDIESRINGLLEQMSLQEKIDQKHGIGIAPMNGLWLTPTNERLGIPGYRMVDGPRGVSNKTGNATAFPVAMARGATWDPELERRIGKAIGLETAAKGGHVTLAPTINMLRHPRWGRAQETYGEDVHHMSRFGVAFIQGAQEHVLASVKHYAGNSIEDTRFDVNVTMDDRTLREIYLPAFHAAVTEANVASVMSAYNKTRGFYMAENAELLGILKNEWGFLGFVESDWLLGTRSTEGSALAGLDIEMPSPVFFGDKLATAVNDGAVPMEVIDESVRRILRRKLEYKLDAPPAPPDPSVIESAEHVALAREAAVKSMVLLKNQAAALPLDAGGLTSIALAGSLAAVANLGDDGSSDVEPSHEVSPLQGITARAGATPVTHVAAADMLTAADNAVVSAAGAAIVVVGLSAADEGENIPGTVMGDRKGLALSPEHVALIQAVAALNPRTIVVLEGGSTLMVEGWVDSVAAVVMAWYPGMEGGSALADLLFGDENFSGKLPVTVPAAESDLPPFDNTSLEVVYEYFHGYRFLDRNGTDPRYPFGFGLSYTTYSYGNLVLASSALGPDDILSASVDVTNTGSMAGEEVVELYVSYGGSSVERAVRDLKALARVALGPGETKTVTLQAPAGDMAYWDTGMAKWVIEPIGYSVHVGGSSRDLPLQASFSVSP
jgi:beta-glucosidase